jgi:large-conductance mechanosensitive channel
MNNLMLLMAQPDGAGTEAGNPIMAFLPFVVIIAIFYFLIIRPKNRQKKEQEEKKKIQTKTQQTKMHWEETSEDNDKAVIPSICPHCKNPNTKKLRECEWCGTKIC